MPTPVGVARQCLTPDAAHALDEAVSVARRRGHAQTTSLHAVSALLSLSSSTLRDACARARNSAYSPRLQFKALELCLSVSLERVPSGQLTDDPPVSNSLMAAIKRSQANQRRQPENFHLYHQLSNQSSINAIKVELQHLILSILDDPVVSRVFCEAGFKSSEIKLAIVRPLPHLFRYARSRGPPLFLCNLGENSGIGSGRPGFNFPFSVFPGFSDVDENVRRIGEVLVRSKGRNPLLVGVCACDALKSFVEALDKRKDGSLPEEVSGLSVVSIENDVSKFAGEDFDKGCVDVKFEELNEAIRQCSGAGLMVNFGDLRAFVGGGGDGESSEEAVSYVVDRLTKLLDTNKEGKKVWLIGAAASYDTYLKFLTKFPSTEKEWDMQILPITTLRPTTAAESCSRSSLMESFVPFAGFFSTSSDFSSPLMSMSYQCVSPCHMYNDKCDRETGAATNVGFTASVADRYQSSLPSWMQMSELGTKGTDVKRKDDNVDKSMKDLGLQSESDAGSQSSKNEPLSEVQTVVGFHSAEEERKETIDNQSIKIKADSSANEMRCRSVDSCMSMESEKVLTSQLGIHSPPVAKSKESFLSKLLENSSRIEDRDSGAAGSPKFSMSNSSIDDGSRTSPASVTSVTISLGSGIHSTSDNSELKKHTNPISCPIPTRSNLFSGTVCGSLAESSSSLYPLACSPVDQQDFKKIFGDLFRKVGRQVEAMNVISHTISSCRSRNSSRSRARGDMWFAFLGPDRVGKRKTAVALSETLRGSKEDLIFVDLSVQDGSPCTDMILNQEMNQYESKYRGKTVVDIIAGELIKKPRSVVLLENVDKADEQVQSSLYQAIFTGKFSDSHGREVSIKNTVFVATSSFTKGDGILCSEQESAQLREERMLGAKRCQMKILVDNAVVDDTISSYPPMSVTSGTSITSQLQVNKRKLTGPSENVVLHECSHVVKRANKTWSRHLDLNLPAEGGEVVDQTSECDVMPENTKAWLLDFLDKMDSSVEFKPYDFDPLVEKVLKEIKESFDETVGTECLLEIDPKVMDQLVAVVYVSDSEKTVVDWVRQILKSEFSEVRRRHKLMPRSVVKLLACEDVFLEEQEPRNCLPTRLIVN